jgi:periplasmic divalent cation tolerance protein
VICDLVKYVQVITTASSKEEAEKISRIVVEKRLAVCAQVLGPIKSVYWWSGNIEVAEEWLCFMKSRVDLYKALESAICNIHSYKVPEILAMPVAKISKSYLDWLESELKK